MLRTSEAGEYEAAFFNFVPFPRGPSEAGSLTEWVNKMARITNMTAVQPVQVAAGVEQVQRKTLGTMKKSRRGGRDGAR